MISILIAEENLDFKVLANQLKSREAIGIDLRTTDELINNPAIGATHIPIDQLSKKMNELDKNKTYFLFCESGRRAGIALEKMQKAGFKKAYSIKDWRNWRQITEPTKPTK